MIIAIDFDGTICADAWPEIGEPIPDSVETVRELHSAGHTLILWTCRSGENLQNALFALQCWGIRDCFHYVNEHPPEQIAKYCTYPRKIGADLYIDDRSVGWQGWAQVRERFGLEGK